MTLRQTTARLASKESTNEGLCMVKSTPQMQGLQSYEVQQYPKATRWESSSSIPSVLPARQACLPARVKHLKQTERPHSSRDASQLRKQEQQCSVRRKTKKKMHPPFSPWQDSSSLDTRPLMSTVTPCQSLMSVPVSHPRLAFHVGPLVASKKANSTPRSELDDSAGRE